MEAELDPFSDIVNLEEQHAAEGHRDGLRYAWSRSTEWQWGKRRRLLPGDLDLWGLR